MKKSLITYSTVDGQTKEICEKISELSNNSFIDILPINKVGSIDAYEKVVIGASIRYGNYRKDVFQFINKNIEIYYPLKEMMIDNAAMIAWACMKFYKKDRNDLFFKPMPRLGVRSVL